MTNATISLKKEHSHIIDEADDSYEDSDGTVTFEFWDCKQTNIEWLLDSKVVEKINNECIPYDLSGGANSDGEAYSLYVRFFGGKRTEKVVKESEAHIPVAELVLAMEEGRLEKVVKSQAEKIAVKPLSDS